MHALDHALAQGSKVNACGQPRIWPKRISAIVLNEVISMTQSGTRNSNAITPRKA